MKRILLWLIIIQSILFGYSYNDLLIKAQTTLFPKILLLDKKLDQKLVDGKILYLIAYEENDRLVARQISDLLKATSQKLDEYQFEIKLIPYAEITDHTEATAIYALNSSTHIAKVVDIATSKGFVTFSYDIANLKEGMLFSLLLEKSTVLYSAKNTMKNYNVDFVDVLYQILRFTDE